MRWILRIAAAVAVVGLLGVLALTMIPADRVAAVVGTEIEAATGQRLTIAGEVRPTLWPEPGVTISDVTIAPPDGPADETLLTAERLSITVDAGALWGGAVRVSRIEIAKPVIRLVRRADGTVNWAQAGGTGTDRVDGGPAAATGGASAGIAGPGGLVLAEGRITDGKVIYADHGAGNAWTAEALDVTLRMPEGPVAATAAFSGQVNGVGLAGSAEIADLAAAVSGAVVPVTGQITSGGSDVRFTGQAGFAPSAAAGQMTARLENPAAFAAVLGQSMPRLPQGLGRETLELTGDLTWTAERSLHLRKGRMVLDGTAFAGDADLTTAGDRPKLTARLTAGAVTLPGGAAAGSGGGGAAGGGAAGGGGAAARGWPTEAIDASGLGLMDTEVRLVADSVTGGGVTAAPVDATLTVERSRGVVDVARAGMFGGGVSGQFVMNNRGSLSVGGTLRAEAVDLQPLLSALAGYDRVTGTGDVAVRFLSSGRSVAAIMAGMSGEGSLSLRNGEVTGFDLAAMLRRLDADRVGTAERTQYDSLTATFDVEEGVLRNRDLRLAAPLVTASGAGVADLGRRTLDYRVVPVALPGADGTSDRRVPLRITGPWDDLSFRLDLAALAEEELQKQEDALRARAEAELAERLGVEQQAGEDLEDAAKRALEQELRKGVERLLGGN